MTHEQFADMIKNTTLHKLTGPMGSVETRPDAESESNEATILTSPLTESTAAELHSPNNTLPSVCHFHIIGMAAIARVSSIIVRAAAVNKKVISLLINNHRCWHGYHT